MAKQTQIKIDKGIPFPGTSKRGSRYPWEAMQVGDSFFVEGAPKGLHAQAAAKKIKITVRKVTERGKEGVRVWRLASPPPTLPVCGHSSRYPPPGISRAGI